MEKESFDQSVERQVLIGIITDTAIASAVSSVWHVKDPGLFRTDIANLVASWSLEYYKRFNSAINDNIRNRFREYQNKYPNEEKAQLIDAFLISLGLEADHKPRQNRDFVINLASDYFTKVRLERIADRIKSGIQTNNIDVGLDAVNSFSRVELGTDMGIDPIRNEEAIRQAFESAGERLIDFSEQGLDDAALFFGDTFSRDTLVGFLASEKSGKCVVGNTRVLCDDGIERTIGDIVENRLNVNVLSWDGKQFHARKITNWFDNGQQECFRIQTKSGRMVEATANHPFLTPDGWEKLENLKKKDFLAAPKRLEVFGNSSVTEDEAAFIAYVTADGCCRGEASVTWTKRDRRLVADFSAVCSRFGWELRKHKVKVHDKFLHGVKSGARARLLCERFGIWGKKSVEKQISNEIMSAPKNVIARFLQILISSDGSFTLQKSGGRCIEYSSSSEVLIKQVFSLLLRFGIVSRIMRRTTKVNGKEFKSWRIIISSDEHIEAFVYEIGWLRDIPNSMTNGFAKSFLDRIPAKIAGELYGQLSQKYQAMCRGAFTHTFGRGKLGALKGQINKGLPIMRQSLLSLRGTDTLIQEVLDSAILWDEIVSIESIGVQQTYDIEVEDLHNFVANDIVVHNSFFLLDMAIRAVQQGKRVAYFEVGDMSQTQVMMRLIQRLSARPKKQKVIKIPERIEFDKKFNADVSFYCKDIKTPLSADAAVKKLARFGKSLDDAFGSDVHGLLRLSCHPSGSMSVIGIESRLDAWERAGWLPDIVVIDYADILAPIDGRQEKRYQVDETWKRLRGLSQKRHICVITASQADAASYRVKTLDKSNFSESKTKLAHVNAFIGINALADEKEKQLRRLNFIVRREEAYSEQECLYVAGCLAIGNPMMISVLPHRN